LLPGGSGIVVKLNLNNFFYPANKFIERGVTMIGDIKAAYDLGKEGIKLIKGIKDKTNSSDPIYEDLEKVYDLISDMKDAITDLKDDFFTLSTEKMALEKKILEFDEWETEKKSFSLEEIASGFFAYVSNDDIKIKLCQKCFHVKKKSILQNSGDSAFDRYKCDNCKAEMLVDKRHGSGRF
jgi:hypothetical protein